jgi:hypothetical protein
MKLRFLAAAILLVFAGAVFVFTGGPLAEGAAAQAPAVHVLVQRCARISERTDSAVRTRDRTSHDSGI